MENFVESRSNIEREGAANLSEVHSEAALSSEQSNTSLPPLQLPYDAVWNVIATVAKSHVDVWLRMIGEQYSGALETLLADMERYYTSEFLPVTTVIEDAWYAVKLEQRGWQRAKALKLFMSRTCFYLADIGDVEVVHVAKVRVLQPRFCLLPAQAFRVKLRGVSPGPLSVRVRRLMLVGPILCRAVAGLLGPGATPEVELFSHNQSTSVLFSINEVLNIDRIKAGMDEYLTASGSDVEVGAQCNFYASTAANPCINFVKATDNPSRPKKPDFGDCPICLDPLGKNQLASTMCGHVFCVHCLERVLRTDKRCPSCRKLMENKECYHLLFIGDNRS